jgi:hypothetical protein
MKEIMTYFMVPFTMNVPMVTGKPSSGAHTGVAMN